MQQVQSTETVQQRPHPNLPAMDISPPATPPPPGTVPVHDTADPPHTATVRFHPNGNPMVTIRQIPKPSAVRQLTFKRTAEEGQEEISPNPKSVRGVHETPYSPVVSRILARENANTNSVMNFRAYNRTLGILLNARCKNILGPQMEPVQFPDESKTHENDVEHGAEEVDEIEDDACQVCFRKPKNCSLAQHKRLGGYACTHKLGLLEEKMRHGLAVITLSVTNPDGTLRCGYCNHFQLDLKKTTRVPKIDIQHLMTHGSLLGDNPDIQEVLSRQKSTRIFFCLECTESFPSYLALLVHSVYSRDHSKRGEIFCNICFNFFDNTTLMSHILRHHNAGVRCPSCNLGFPTMMDMLNHLMSPRVHFQLSPDAINMLTYHQLKEVASIRNANIGPTARTEVVTREVLRKHNMIHLARYLNQMELITNFQMEVQAEDTGLPDIIELVAKHLDRDSSLRISAIVQNLKLGNTKSINLQDVEKYQYELRQITVGTFTREMIRAGVKTPDDIGNHLYGEDSYVGQHLLSSSILTYSTDELTKSDYEPYNAIVIGTAVLEKAGTLLSAPFRVLNLSPEASGEQKWPTQFFVHMGENTVQGMINLDGKPAVHIPSDRNYLQHIKEMMIKAPQTVPIFIELNIYPLLKNYSPSAWVNILKKNLREILLGFFCGLSRACTEIEMEKGACPEIIVIGQPPFSGDHQIKASQLIRMWQYINIGATLISRFTKTIFIPSSGIIGHSERFYANILEKPHAMFLRNHNLSSYAAHQSLKIIETYCKARQETLAILRNQN